MKAATCLQGLLLAAAGFTGAAQAAEPSPATQEPSASALRTVRDASTGRLRAATADEAREMGDSERSRRAGGRHGAGADNPHQGLARRAHRGGAASVRMSEEFASHVVVVRNADGSLSQQCLPAGQAKQATQPAQSFAKRYVPGAQSTAKLSTVAQTTSTTLATK